MISLSITHNDHRVFYHDLAEYIADGELYYLHFKDEESKNRCIEFGEIWEMVWYPRTPNCCEHIAAPSFTELILLAKEVAGEDNMVCFE